MRYDCARELMVVFVEAIRNWAILPSNADNYVKIGQTDKLVDGSSGNNGTPPDFAYISSTGWEASFHLARRVIPRRWRSQHPCRGRSRSPCRPPRRR